MVSIIVPCFNHAAYLQERLNSIRRQTYKNTEIILLDDGSSDDSPNILNQFKQQDSGNNVKVILNRENTGSVFQQWEKGLKSARGTIIWIAESDDSCDEEFLEKLVPHFRQDSVLVAFANTIFINANGEQRWSLSEYLADSGLNLKHRFRLSSHDMVNKIWHRKNIIPNVSGCLFRAANAYSIFNEIRSLNLTVCGDWIFYLHVSMGGHVSYEPYVFNYYRQHDSNTSKSLRLKTAYFKEHFIVSQWICSHFRLSHRVIHKMRAALYLRWQETIDGRSKPDSQVRALINDLRTLTIQDGRKANILIVTYSLVPGGGEIFPLRLANGLRSKGWSVTVLNCNQLPSQPNIRQILDDNVPLIQLNSLRQLDKIIQDFAIDIIHTHHAWVDATMCEYVHGRKDIKHVVTSHGMYDTLDADHLKSIGQLLKGRVSQFTYVANKNQKALSLLGIDQNFLTAIPNASPQSSFRSINRDALGLQDNAFVITLVSRAIVEKGWQIAIDAVIKVREACHVDVQLLLVGDGPEAAQLQHQYLDTKGIHFLGLVPDSRPYFAIADLGLLPSFFSGESQPLTLIESLQAGCPYLASDIGEIRSMLSTSSGLAGAVIPLQNGKADSLAFAEAIQTYIQTPELLAVQRNRCDEAAQKFSWDRMLNAYIDVYKKAHTSTLQP
ncbi:MAG: glycosyltransferase [Cyanobacteriota bacterium]|nr:glycosyltransferase [Cyanobacteriota bacterium]